MHAGRGGGLWFLTANCLILSNPPLTAVSHTFILTGLWSICWTMLRGNTHQQGSRDGDRLSGLAVSKGRHRHRRAWCLWLSRIVSSGSCSGKVEDVYVKIPHVLPMAPSPRRTNLIVSIATFRARFNPRPAPDHSAKSPMPK